MLKTREEELRKLKGELAEQQKKSSILENDRNTSKRQLHEEQQASALLRLDLNKLKIMLSGQHRHMGE